MKQSLKKWFCFYMVLMGALSFSKPLFKNLSEYKIVAIEQRGHDNSLLPSSRSVSKHINDFKEIINKFSLDGYKIWVFGESMGAAYSVLLSREKDLQIEGIFAQSIPNKLVDIMEASTWTKFKVQFMTTLSYLTNINYKYRASVNYEKLSSNKAIQRMARIADKTKTRQIRETLATWKANKLSWKILLNKTTVVLFIIFYQVMIF